MSDNDSLAADKRPTKSRKIRSVSCKGFTHNAANSVSVKSPNLLENCTEVLKCTYVIDKNVLWDEQSRRPLLKSEICEFIDANSWKNEDVRSKYIGADLTKGFENYVPVDLTVLGSVKILMQAYNRHKNHFSDGKTTFISLRHHVIDIIMAPFQEDPTSLLFTVLPDRNIVISVDRSSEKEQGIHNNADRNIRRVCFTGFALEHLLVEDCNNSANSSTDRELFFSIVHGSLNDEIDILMQAEIDSYNKATDIYTEIKSSVNFRMGNTFHRRKLLRMWLQTSLLPKSDLLIGYRNPYSNELEHLQPYKIQDIYNKFNNRSILSKPGKFYRFNALVAKDWFDFIMPTLRSNLLELYDPETSSTFKVKIDPSLNLRITPTNQNIRDLVIE